MARLPNNMLTHSARGAVGKEFVYKNINGKDFLCKFPDMSRVQYNDEQIRYRKLFADAVAYAREVQNDPKRYKAYEKLIRNDKRKRGTIVHHAAIKAFIAKYSWKIPKSLVRSALKEYTDSHTLNSAQINALEFLMRERSLTNKNYQQLNRVSKATATRHLQDLVDKEILKVPSKGAGAIYSLAEPNGELQIFFEFKDMDLI